MLGMVTHPTATDSAAVEVVVVIVVVYAVVVVVNALDVFVPVVAYEVE